MRRILVISLLPVVAATLFLYLVASMISGVVCRDRYPNHLTRATLDLSCLVKEQDVWMTPDEMKNGYNYTWHQYYFDTGIYRIEWWARRLP